MKKVTLIISFVLLASSNSFSQDIRSLRDSSKIRVEMGVPFPEFPDSLNRPEITLQEALALAEKYIKSAKIDIKHYYLFEARMIFYGPPEGEKEERWYFWWVNENKSDGDYIEITVSMDGTVNRLSSM
jgi:hypothetical protein